VKKGVLFAYICALCTFQSFGAIDIIFDYTYDTSNWFGDEQRYIMDQAAYAFESRLGSETFGSLIPSTYGSGLDGTLTASNPVTGGTLNVSFGSLSTDGVLFGSADTITIFPGAGAASGGTLAWASGITNPIVPGDAWYDYINNTRDTSTNYDSVGGTISVNHSYNWYFDTDLTDFDNTTNKFDFYSTMVHEIGHLMGFRDQSDAWDILYDDVTNTWIGTEGVAAYSGNPIPMDAASKSHFNKSALNSAHVGCKCHPVMDVSSGQNERASFSELDFAVLKDIGYSISATPVATAAAGVGGSTTNTYSDPAQGWGGNYYVPIREDYATWVATYGTGAVGGDFVPPSVAPEPAYIFPFMGGFLFLLRGRKKIRKIKSYLLPSFP
jgi:hypothetical protein